MTLLYQCWTWFAYLKKVLYNKECIYQDCEGYLLWLDHCAFACNTLGTLSGALQLCELLHCCVDRCLPFNFQSVKEEVFWRNYFYRVSLIKQSAQLTALAAQQQAAEKRQEEKTEDTTDGDMPGIGIPFKLLMEKVWHFKLCSVVASLDGACFIFLCRNHQTENPSHFHQHQAKVKWGRMTDDGWCKWVAAKWLHFV